jgi:hypothetical protein
MALNHGTLICDATNLSAEEREIQNIYRQKIYFQYNNCDVHAHNIKKLSPNRAYI